MSKSLALATVLLASIAIAHAANTKLKIKEFFPVNGAPANADGMAFFTFSSQSGCTDIRVHVTHLAPNTRYGVLFTGGVDADVPPAGGILTNPAGNGHFTITCLPGQTLDIPVMVEVYEDTNSNDAFDDGEQRLVGDSL